MTIIAFAPRATYLPLDPTPATQAMRSVVGQYWRRHSLAQKAAAPLAALSVFDEALAQALLSVKLHLQHDPSLRPALIDAARQAGGQGQRQQAACFALACLELLTLQLGQADDLPAEFGGAWLAQAPEAVFDALRFCFDDAVGRYLAKGVPDTVGTHPQGALAHVLLRLAVARPAASDAFSHEIAQCTTRQSTGLAALAHVRTAGPSAEHLALLALKVDPTDDAALLALALSRSDALAGAIRSGLAASEQPSVAILGLGAGCLMPAQIHAAAAQWHGLSRSHSASPRLLYLGALLGHATLLREAADAVDWHNESACRAVRDAAGLLCGTFDDSLFDLGLPANERQAQMLRLLEAAVQHHPPPAPLRLGAPQADSTLQDAAQEVGAPLRQWLYLEHAARAGSAIWLASDDLAQVQAMGLATACMLERWAQTLRAGRAP